MLMIIKSINVYLYTAIFEDRLSFECWKFRDESLEVMTGEQS